MRNLKRMLQLILAFFMISQSTSICHAGNGASFLRITPDARLIGLGGNHPSYFLGSGNVLTNPSLIALVPNSSIQLSGQIVADMYHYGAFTYVKQFHPSITFGLGMIGVFIDNIEAYDKYGNFQYTFMNYQGAFISSIAFKLQPVLIGLSLKYVRIDYLSDKIDNWGHGAGFDIGMYYDLTQHVKFGFLFQGRFQMKWQYNYSEKVKNNIIFGLSYYPHLISKNFFHVIISFNQIEAEPMRTNIGLEIFPLSVKNDNKSICLNLGVGNVNLEKGDIQIPYSTYFTNEVTFAAGIGFSIHSKSFQMDIDYGMKSHKILNAIHMITTKIWI